ncbi:MAG: ATP-binding protein [Flavobacteriaceae bacterium]|nr:ATP-binding protein [Flavobacteriaceae bacterium]
MTKPSVLKQLDALALSISDLSPNKALLGKVQQIRKEVENCIEWNRDTSYFKDNDKLKRSISNYKRILNNVQCSIIIHDLNGKMMEFNHFFGKEVGYKLSELRGRNLEDFLDPNYKQAFPGYLEKLKKNSLDTGVMPFLSKVGEVIYMRYRNILVKETNKAPHILCFAFNDTPKIMMHKKLLKSQFALSKAVKAKDRFIANISHEIRTPLNGIIGFTELLLEDGALHTHNSYVEMINGASKTLLNLINDILDYSKLSAGKMVLENTPFNFYKLIKDVSYLIEALLAHKDVGLHIHIDKNIPENLIGDPSKLSQVLLNLLGNATKFTEQGKVSLHIALQYIEDNEALLIFKIRDTGIGIDSGQLDHIFDAFQQASNSTARKYGGTGLGLSIVQKIIEASLGEIEVSSVLGEGTCFKFTMPFKMPFESNVMPTKESNLESEIKDYLDGASILVFEDNTLSQKVIKHRLERWGCDVSLAATGEAGLDILEKKVVDLVLLDLRLPDKNGFEVAYDIRSNSNSYIHHIPIIAFTALYTEEDRRQSKKYGINDYVPKPFSSEELLRKLLQHIRARTKMETFFKQQYQHVMQKSSRKSCVNLQNVLNDCMQEVVLLKDLIQNFKEKCDAFIHLTNNLIMYEDAKNIETTLKRIKPELTMMGAVTLLKLVEQMQAQCTDHLNMVKFEGFFNLFKKQYPLVLEDIEEQLKAIGV